MSQAASKRHAASPVAYHATSSPLVARGVSALLLALLTACGAEMPTDPTGPTPAGAGALVTLTGATSTPILPAAIPGEPQARGDARGLNASGQVTGAELGMTPSDDFRPYRWTASGATMLVGCCGTAWGADLNDGGVVVGTTQQSQVVGARGFVATGISMETLSILPGADPDLNASAVAINNAGQIAGTSPSGDFTSAHHAVLWSASRVIQDLGTLGGTRSAAIDINGSGQVIGWSQIAGDAATHFFLWSASNGMRDLNVVIGPAITNVVEINDVGQIIGTFTTTDGQSHAFVYSPGSGLRDLGTLGGTTSTPTGLNNHGQVVGSSTTASGETHAFLWTPTDGIADISAIAGITNVGRLNDNLQTVSGHAAPGGFVSFAKSGIPQLVQLEVTTTR